MLSQLALFFYDVPRFWIFVILEFFWFCKQEIRIFLFFFFFFFLFSREKMITSMSFEKRGRERHDSSTISEYLRLQEGLEKSRLHIFSLRRLHQERWSLSGAILSPSRRRMQREKTRRTREITVFELIDHIVPVYRSIFSIGKIDIFFSSFFTNNPSSVKQFHKSSW